MIQLDMTGKPCPIPVMQTRKALDSQDVVMTLVDNAIAVQNLEKMAQGEGLQCSWKELAKDRFEVTLSKRGTVAHAAPETLEKAADQVASSSSLCGATLLVTRESLGSGAEELGLMLMKGFVFSLTELPRPPAQVIFLNGGAKLTTQGASTEKDLQTLAGKGVQIFTCGTCANYYGIADKLAVGEITDMMKISQMVADAQRVITL